MNLIYNKETPLFVLSLIVSAALWLALVVGTVGTALLWILLFFVAYLFAQSAFISYLKGTAVHVTAQQFPDLHERIGACAATLGMKEVPEAYLLHGNGVFNALATRFLGRHFIVLYSDVVDALEERPEALNFYIGHELGHIRRRHLVWGPLLAPAGLLPLLGAAYSRSREYTCDRHGLACCDNPEDARRGLAALAAGGKRWKTLSEESYIGQSRASAGFWMSFHELIGDYPWLVKRMAALQALSAKQPPKPPRRSVLAWALAAFIPRLGTGAGAGSALVVVAVIGILAAIAIPAYHDYTMRAKVVSALPRADAAKAAVVDYAIKNQAWPRSNADAGVPETGYGPDIRSLRVEEGGVVDVSIAGGEVVYTPYVKDQKIVWQCSAENLPPKYLPPDCR